MLDAAELNDIVEKNQADVFSFVHQIGLNSGERDVYVTLFKSCREQITWVWARCACF